MLYRPSLSSQANQLAGLTLTSFHSTQPVQTLFLFKSIWIRPQGSQGCQKIRFFFSQMKVFSFCAKIASKRHKLQKTIKIEETMSKNPCFLRLFQIFFNLGAILANQTSTGIFSGSWLATVKGVELISKFSLCFANTSHNS